MTSYTQPAMQKSPSRYTAGDPASDRPSAETQGLGACSGYTGTGAAPGV